MKKELIIKNLERENKEDLEQLNLTEKEYKKLKENWLNKESDEFEIIGKIELRKQIIRDLTNNP